MAIYADELQRSLVVERLCDTAGIDGSLEPRQRSTLAAAIEEALVEAFREGFGAGRVAERRGW